MKEHRDDGRTADFGFERVPWGDKKRRVRGVFDSVAPRYDLMNDVMSGGLHRLWKRAAIAYTGLRPGQHALDVAAGSGDLAQGLARRVGRAGRVIVTDINARMLAEGRDRLYDAGLAGNVDYLLADAEALPFRDGAFHCVTIGFGLRNVTDKERGARLDVSRFEAGRPARGARLLEGASRPARTDLRAVFVSRAAAARRVARARCR